MFEAKYRKYITHNTVRFSEESEIIACTVPFSQGAGVPLYPDGCDSVRVDSSDVHTMVIGPTGCKKSRIIARNTIASVIERGESAIITDPKGELYKSMCKRAK